MLSPQYFEASFLSLFLFRVFWNGNFSMHLVDRSFPTCCQWLFELLESLSDGNIFSIVLLLYHRPFPEKNYYPPVEDINGNFQGGKTKIDGNPEGMLKIEEKTWISRGWIYKEWWNSMGVTVKLTGIPGGQIIKDFMSSTGGGAQFFSGKAQLASLFLRAWMCFSISSTVGGVSLTWTLSEIFRSSLTNIGSLSFISSGVELIYG